MVLASDSIAVKASKDYPREKIDLRKVSKDWVAGTCAGIASVLSGHPFEYD